jgi:TP901-1 family phage major tail protein
MTAQKGKDLLLKLDNDGLGAFVTVAGLRAKTFTINSETVDITTSESAGRWRELLDAAGTQHARLTGKGIFKNAASDTTIRQLAFAGTIRAWQIVVPGFGTVSGPFQITTLEFSAQHHAEVAFDITLESAGEIIFTALPA